VTRGRFFADFLGSDLFNRKGFAPNSSGRVKILLSTRIGFRWQGLITIPFAWILSVSSIKIPLSMFSGGATMIPENCLQLSVVVACAITIPEKIMIENKLKNNFFIAEPHCRYASILLAAFLNKRFASRILAY
jgi:hypothetical protein